MNLKKKINTVISGFGTHGSEFLLYLISVCCPAWLFRYSHTYLFQGKDLFINSRTNEGYEIRFLTVEDIGKLKNFRTSMVKAQYRLNRGDVCVVTVKNADDSVVASMWAATDMLYSEYTGTILVMMVFIYILCILLKKNSRKEFILACCSI